jgi:Tol biopolymer transport system component
VKILTIFSKVRIMKKTIFLIVVLGLVSDIAIADYIFGEPTNLGPPVNSASTEQSPSLSADGLSLFFASNRSGGSGGRDLWVTKRETIHDDWGQPVNLGTVVNIGAEDRGTSISADGLELYFHSGRSGGQGGDDILVTTRASIEDDWGAPVNLGPAVNSSGIEHNPYISADSLTLVFASTRSGGSGDEDIWITTRDTVNHPWAQAVNLGPLINSSSKGCGPSLSPDGSKLFFQSTRPGGSGLEDIWVSTRASISGEWGQPVNLGPTVNSSAHDYHPEISRDGSTLYFSSMRSGGKGGQDLWQVSISPVVDLNGDGIVDSADMCLIVDHWGENYSLCDIGPTPLGDGIVDTQDLIVLSEYLFVDINDPTLAAHWALDEAQGVIAYDSAADYDGTLMGGPVWQPDGGVVAGALQFDGIDDYISTGHVSNPADGAFSVVAWIVGGAPGQVVLSQADGANWLCMDSVGGNLMTGLVPPAGRSPSPTLVSEFMITDGNWHQIGFVWDGTYRRLYVDGFEVAKDTQIKLEGSVGGLYIGTGKAMEPGTYFSGLIDDVRIYNRVVIP